MQHTLNRWWFRRWMLVGLAPLLSLTMPSTAAAQFDFGVITPAYADHENRHNPSIAFGENGCLPSSAVNAHGDLNQGMGDDRSVSRGCRGDGSPNLANAYVRSCCARISGRDMCAYVYGFYFVKDFISNLWPGGHVHDWEHVIVYATDGKVTHGGASAHGTVKMKAWSEILAKSEDQSSFKVVYHKDGLLTHAMRFATVRDLKTAEFHSMNLLSWRRMSPTVQDALGNKTHFGKASLKLRNDRFWRLINNSEIRPEGYPSLTVAEGHPYSTDTCTLAPGKQGDRLPQEG